MKPIIMKPQIIIITYHHFAFVFFRSEIDFPRCRRLWSSNESTSCQRFRRTFETVYCFWKTLYGYLHWNAGMENLKPIRFHILHSWFRLFMASFFWILDPRWILIDIFHLTTYSIYSRHSVSHLLKILMFPVLE